MRVPDCAHERHSRIRSGCRPSGRRVPEELQAALLGGIQLGRRSCRFGSPRLHRKSRISPCLSSGMSRAQSDGLPAAVGSNRTRRPSRPHAWTMIVCPGVPVDKPIALRRGARSEQRSRPAGTAEDHENCSPIRIESLAGAVLGSSQRQQPVGHHRRVVAPRAVGRLGSRHEEPTCVA